VAGTDAPLRHHQSRSIKAAPDRAGMPARYVDLFEIKEAFAGVVVASADDLGVSTDVKVNGGAIAIGRPQGRRATGSRCTWRWNLPASGGGS
jgi:acetyl-CoA C-acetyltransferase